MSHPNIHYLLSSSERHQRMLNEIRAGLMSTPKAIPAKYRYDARGSELFQQITTLPEYYPARIETAILEGAIQEIYQKTCPSEVLELGAGFSRKTQLLVEAMSPQPGQRYVTIDISDTTVQTVVQHLALRYPWLRVEGIVGDLEQHIQTIPYRPHRLIVLLGTTLGNLLPLEQRQFLTSVRGLMRKEDWLLVGIDLIKSPDVLEAAYNDNLGLSAEFNLNLIHMLNLELNAHFPIEAFEHQATYNTEQSRIEVSLHVRQSVSTYLDSIDCLVQFTEGEQVLTGFSYKFTEENVKSLLQDTGLTLENWYTDPQQWCALALMVANVH